MLFDLNMLRHEIDEGNIKAQAHPALPLMMFTTTTKPLNNRSWNEVTKRCRGLIVERNTGEIISRPLEKFFSYTETDFFKGWEDDTSIEVTELIDGILGILYPDPSQPTGYAIATPDGFTSDTAVHATARYQESHSTFKPRPGFTYLFEIVYPENRKVVNYGQDDNLYLVGVVNNSNGQVISITHGSISIPRARVYKYGSYVDFLQYFHRGNGGSPKGYVVRNLTTDEIVKFKTEDYLTLHRLVVKLNAVRVWEAFRDYRTAELVDVLPTEELKEWTIGVLDHLSLEYELIQSANEKCFFAVMASLVSLEDLYGTPEHRRVFASTLKTITPNFPVIGSRLLLNNKVIFRLYDGYPVNDVIIRMIKPSGEWRP